MSRERGEGRRVAVTGMAGLSPLGASWEAIGSALKRGCSGIRALEEFSEVEGLRTCLGGPIEGFELSSEDYPRKKLRSMGRVARLATRATELAIDRAKLGGSPLLSDGRTGLAYGSSSGSPQETVDFGYAVGIQKSIRGVLPVTYLRFMSQTCVVNLAQFFEVRGRILPTCSACTSGSQAIGLGYEQIRYGLQDRMICGGAEELHVTEVAIFDIMQATSTRNDAPTAASRPFDRDRDGLVVSEGAATLVLEEWESARHRGAEILAEVVGYGNNCDGMHVVAPHSEGMEGAMRLALDDAGLAPEEIGYVNAHATATELGDIAESHATHRLLGRDIPISTFKGHLGHSLGACGSLEAWLSLEMMREGWVAPTLNLDDPDPLCAELDYVRDAPRVLEFDCLMSNNFAFGGVNTSLIFRRPPD